MMAKERGIDNSANPMTYCVDTDTIILVEPENMGDTFLGWYSDARCTKKVTSITKGSTGAKTLYAKWEQTRYTLLYNLNDGGDDTTVLDTSKVGYITSYESNTENGYLLPTATRTGYTFGGWYKDAACRSAVGPIVSSPNVDMTVYAKWIPIQYVVRFDGNGSTKGSMRNLTVNYGVNTRLTANAYVKTGEKFVGWNTSQDGSGVTYKN